MKQVVWLLFLLLPLAIDTTAQDNIFFKKGKSKYVFTAKTPLPAKNKHTQFPPRISLYTISSSVNRGFRFSMPRKYESTSDRDVILFILGLGGSIAASIYADKMHYNYSGDLLRSMKDY